MPSRSTQARCESSPILLPGRKATDPAAVTEDDVRRLRDAGFDDLDILDANAQCAHLNYVNRVVMGLGIHSVVDPDFPAYSAIPDTEPA